MAAKIELAVLLACATLVLGSIACGGDDEGSGGSATGTGTGTGTGEGGTGGTGEGGSGGTNTGAGGSATGTGGMGTGGASPSECEQICEGADEMGCPDQQCLSNCQNTASSAMNTGCTAELKAYFDCMLALPNICDATECNDEIQAVSQCTMRN